MYQAGNAYVSGETVSANCPTTPGAFQPVDQHGADAFVTTLNFTGSALAYSTYLGGSATDNGQGVAVDQSGSAYTGFTSSSDFPTTPGCFRKTLVGSFNAYVTKLDPTSALAYSTHVRGQNTAFDIVVDDAGGASIVGTARAPDVPVTPDALQLAYAGGGNDVLLAGFNPSGSVLVHATYLGGSGNDEGYSIALDRYGSAYVTGSPRRPTSPPLPGASTRPSTAPATASWPSWTSAPSTGARPPGPRTSPAPKATTSSVAHSSVTASKAGSATTSSTAPAATMRSVPDQRMTPSSPARQRQHRGAQATTGSSGRTGTTRSSPAPDRHRRWRPRHRPMRRGRGAGILQSVNPSSSPLGTVPSGGGVPQHPGSP